MNARRLLSRRNGKVAPLLVLLVTAGCWGGSVGEPQVLAFPLSRAQAVPDGVPEHVSRPDEPASSPCPEYDVGPLPSGKAVQFNARDLAGRGFAAVPGRRLPLGTLLSVCVSGYRSDLAIDAEVTSAGKPPVRHRWPAGGDSTVLNPWVMVAAGPLGVGKHRLTIRQEGAVPRTFAFVVDDAELSAGLWTNGSYWISAGQPITIGSGGSAPRENVHYDFYAKGDGQQYDYWSSVAVKADERGVALTVVPTRAAEGRSFLVLRRGSPNAPTTIDVVGTEAGRPEGKPVDKPRSLFQRHDAPSAGVARQVTYFQEGGPSDCRTPKTTRPTVVLERGPPREISGNVGGPDHFDLGDHIQMCAFNFIPGVAATLTIERPDGSRGARAFPIEPFPEVGETSLIMPDAPIGTYRVTIRQGVLSASVRFPVHVPTIPGYETTVSKDGDPLVVVVGLPPHQRFRLSLYREPTQVHTDPAIPTQLVAGFVTSVVVRADERGTAVYRLRRAPGDPKACFIVKVSYGKHLLSDKRNALSTICVPDRMYRDPRL